MHAAGREQAPEPVAMDTIDGGPSSAATAALPQSSPPSGRQEGGIMTFVLQMLGARNPDAAAPNPGSGSAPACGPVSASSITAGDGSATGRRVRERGTSRGSGSQPRARRTRTAVLAPDMPTAIRAAIDGPASSIALPVIGDVVGDTVSRQLFQSPPPSAGQSAGTPSSAGAQGQRRLLPGEVPALPTFVREDSTSDASPIISGFLAGTDPALLAAPFVTNAQTQVVGPVADESAGAPMADDVEMTREGDATPLRSAVVTLPREVPLSAVSAVSAEAARVADVDPLLSAAPTVIDPAAGSPPSARPLPPAGAELERCQDHRTDYLERCGLCAANLARIDVGRSPTLAPGPRLQQCLACRIATFGQMPCQHPLCNACVATLLGLPCPTCREMAVEPRTASEVDLRWWSMSICDSALKCASCAAPTTTRTASDHPLCINCRADGALRTVP